MKLKRRKKKPNKTLILTYLLLITFLFIGAGYSVINNNLNITGNINLKKYQDVWAINLSYDNTKTKVNCSTSQCMIDYLAKRLK